MSYHVCCPAMSPLDRLNQLKTVLPSSSLGSAGAQGERVAVLLKMGLDGYDRWQAAKPLLFWGGLIGATVSAAALYKRRRTPEAYPLYLATLAASLAAAWVGRPGARPPPPAPGQPAPAGPGLLGWVDAKRAEFAAEDPQWVRTTLDRARRNPEVRPLLDATPILSLIA